MWSTARRWFQRHFLSSMSEEEFSRRRGELLEKTPIPVFWLFGKTGSGKTSTVKYLTGAQDAQIGNGYQPETRFSQKYAFPDGDHPILQFLDTRGLGEIHYEAEEDIRQLGDSAHLMIVTVRLADHAVEPVLTPLKLIRRKQPQRPVVLALTCLHELHPGRHHPQPDPFPDAITPDNAETVGFPEIYREAIRTQLTRFAGLYDRVVPLDLTPEEEGFEEPEYGGQRLKSALLDLLPDAYRQTVLNLEGVMSSLKNLTDQRAAPYIMSSSTLAASAATVPVPWIDLPVVAAIQTDLVRRLAGLYGQDFDIQEFFATTGAVGGPLVLRQMLRETLKVIPGVGIAANAALAFASTYALGEACCWYYSERQRGHAPTSKELRGKLQEQMSVARRLWEKNQPESTPAQEPPQ